MAVFANRVTLHLLVIQKTLMCVMMIIVILQSCSHPVMVTLLLVLRILMVRMFGHALLALRCIFDPAANSVKLYVLTVIVTRCVRRRVTIVTSTCKAR